MDPIGARRREGEGIDIGFDNGVAYDGPRGVERDRGAVGDGWCGTAGVVVGAERGRGEAFDLGDRHEVAHDVDDHVDRAALVVDADAAVAAEIGKCEVGADQPRLGVVGRTVGSSLSGGPDGEERLRRRVGVEGDVDRNAGRSIGHRCCADHRQHEGGAGAQWRLDADTDRYPGVQHACRCQFDERARIRLRYGGGRKGTVR